MQSASSKRCRITYAISLPRTTENYISRHKILAFLSAYDDSNLRRDRSLDVPLWLLAKGSIFIGKRATGDGLKAYVKNGFGRRERKKVSPFVTQNVDTRIEYQTRKTCQSNG